MDEFTEKYVSDNRIQAITDKVTVSDTDELTVLCPQKRVAEVTVTTKNGVFSKRVDYPKGEPENPMSEPEFRERYNDLMAYGQIDRPVFEAVYEMAGKPDVKVLDLIKDL